jgi:hypothetical protein
MKARNLLAWNLWKLATGYFDTASPPKKTKPHLKPSPNSVPFNSVAYAPKWDRSVATATRHDFFFMTATFTSSPRKAAGARSKEIQKNTSNGPTPFLKVPRTISNRGAELLDLTLVSFGGAARVDRLKTLQDYSSHLRARQYRNGQ